MTSRRWQRNLAVLSLGIFCFFSPVPGQADPSKYPQFAQQTLPADIKPEFISIDDLVKTLKGRAKPVILDVRSAEEFREAHILSALSAPLAEFKDYLKSIPRDRPVVLY